MKTLQAIIIITIINIFSGSLGFSQNCKLSQYDKKANDFTIPTQAIVLDALSECNKSAQIDSIDMILLLLNIPDYRPAKNSSSYSQSSYDWQKVHDQTYSRLVSSGVSPAQAQQLANQAAVLSDPATGDGIYFIISCVVGYRTPNGMAKEQRRDAVDFRIYYNSGQWYKAAELIRYGAAENSPLLAARAIRRAVEAGSLPIYDEPGRIMDKKGFINTSLYLYSEAISKLEELPLNNKMKETIKREYDAWKQKNN